MNRLIIKCPHCGAEYLPSEIYIPSDFLPTFKDLTKTDSGKVVAVYENPMNLDEEYTCDYCGHRFGIHADVSFTTNNCEKHDYKSEFISPLYKEAREELSES